MCDDLISRKALLKAMDTWDKFGFSNSGAFVREPENDDYVPYVHYDDMVKCVEGMQTADVVEKFIDELTKEISDRVIRALEANYEIIPKKPVVLCKACKHYQGLAECELIGCCMGTDGYCSWGERSEE